MIELSAGPARAHVLAADGGRIGALTVDGVDLLVTSHTATSPMLWGCFPLAPWAGRIRNGRFTHEGMTHQLAVNVPPHAIHGTAFAQRWSVTDAGRTNATLSCALGDAWPLGGSVEQRITLRPGSLECSLRVVAADRSMPAELGWHPWFAATGPVDLDAAAMYERDAAGIPTGRVVAPHPPPWDDCFRTTRPVGIRVGPFDVRISSDCDHVIVFDGLDTGTAIEPQSGPPDAFNLHPRVLPPGAMLERTMTITWLRTLPTRG